MPSRRSLHRPPPAFAGAPSILRSASLGLAPRRTHSVPTWRELVRAQASGLVAANPFHVVTVALTRLYTFVVTEMAHAPSTSSGVITHPTAAWTTQPARSLLTDLEDRITGFRNLLRDYDNRYTQAFGAVFTTHGIKILKNAPQTPRMNAHVERLIPATRAECSNRLLFYNEQHQQWVLTQYAEDCNNSRSHRALQLRVPSGGPDVIPPPRPTKPPPH